MKKVLFIATVVRKHINVFHLPFLKMFQEAGYTTYVAAANDTEQSDVVIPYCDHYVEIDFKRNPLHLGNIKSYTQLKKLIDDNDFEIIHCHTPVGGLLGRLAGIRARKHGTKVLYTAHGFHFYKGAPLKNWLLYYPVEKFCAHFTDVLITINNEDYALAKKKMKAKRVEYVPGVGIDISKFENIQIDRNAKRRELGVPEDAFVLTSVGEISKRKNHIAILQALTKIDNENIHYVIVGKGSLLDELQSFAKDHAMENRVHFLGFRSDVAEIYKASDVCCLPSVHEGLPVALMEGMASGLPCVASRIRGNTDLIDDSDCLVNYWDYDGFATSIKKLIDEPEMRNDISKSNIQRVRNFEKQIVLEKMMELYNQLSV